MAEQSKIDQKSGSQFQAKPLDTVRNPLAKPLPRNHPTQTNRKITQRNLDIHNSHYFKIRSLVQELRPHFLERALATSHPMVLKTPDFQNCNGAHEIRKHEAYDGFIQKKMTMEAAPTGKLKKVPEHQPSSSSSCTNLPGKETRSRGRPTNQPKLHVTERVPTFERPLQPPHFSYGDSQSQPKGSYVVGGSYLGLNFITYRGSEPVYYGVMKEMHRHSLGRKRLLVHENAVEPSKLKSQNGMSM